jgi:fluoride ion exporter CrcB/FEX
MDMLVLVTIGGFVGGLVRGLIGVLKAVRMGRKLRARYFITTLVASALIGAIAGLFAENDFRFSILAGYIGGDFIESLYKVRFRTIYKPSNRKVKIP